MNELGTALVGALNKAGFLGRVTGGEMVAEMDRALKQLSERRIMPREIYEEYFCHLAAANPSEGETVRSLVVVAAPAPPVKVLFDLGERELETIIPSTYVYSRTQQHTLQVMREVLTPAGYTVVSIALPAKMLAVKLGLAKYGRNGLAYVDGFGSFARLDVYATDASLVADGAQGNEQVVAGGGGADLFPEWLPVPPHMYKCMGCAWCYYSCPTGCIDPEGDRIDPLRCLAYINEHTGEWPAWLDPSAHNSLLGCRVCEEGCRINVDGDYLLPAEWGASFTREETAALLNDLPLDEIPPTLRSKLEALDLIPYLPVLGRNLRALVAQAEREPATCRVNW